jgi:hypothetical protein
MDSQHRCASKLSNLVLQRDFASGFDGRCQRACENGALDEEECFIDATFVMAKGGGSEIKVIVPWFFQEAP